jgi:hypothetical protein
VVNPIEELYRQDAKFAERKKRSEEENSRHGRTRKEHGIIEFKS